MSQTVITQAFEELKAQEAANGGVLTLDEFVFASVPDLNITDPIDRTEGLPPAAQIVHRQAVSKTGMVNSNAVVYSVVLGADVGDFEFNWVGLLNKASGVVAMIVHAPSQKKIRTQSGQQGNVLTRSFLMEYNGASTETQITTPADTWQIDFTARLNGVDERIRKENKDTYGAASFLKDGFLVSGANGNYLVKKGAAYIEGLRAELLFDQAVAVASRPAKIWVDVCWHGTLTSVWAAATKITVADTLANYVSGDEQHYVFAIAEILADGSVIDLRLASAMAQLVGLSPEPDTVPYFDKQSKLKKSALSDFSRDMLAAPDAQGALLKLGLEYVRGESREALRLAYARAGFHLVDGSFESGGAVATANDVLLYATTGEAYAWGGALPKTVNPESTPVNTEAGVWVNVSGYAIAQFPETPNIELSGPLEYRTPAGSFKNDMLRFNPIKTSLFLCPDEVARAETGINYPPPYIGENNRPALCHVIAAGSKLDDETREIRRTVAFGPLIGSDPLDWNCVDAFGLNPMAYAGRVERTTAVGSEVMAWFGAPDQNWLRKYQHDYWRKPADNPYLPGEAGWDAAGLETAFPGIGQRLADFNNYATSSAEAGYSMGVGRDALNHIVAGTRNSAGGYGALQHLFSGSNNSAFGALALGSMVFGEANTAVGDHAGRYANDCYNVTFLGYGCGRTVKGAIGSVIIGDRAADNVSNATRAVIIGPEAGRNHPTNLDNKLLIANQPYGGNLPLISGDFSPNNVGVNILPENIRARLHVRYSSSGSVLTPQVGALIEGSSSAALTLETTSAGFGQLRFADVDSNSAGFIEYSHSSDSITLGTAGTARVRVEATGALIPAADNTNLFGRAAFRWGTLYAGTGSINTSNETHKEREEILEAEKAAALEIKKDIWKFKFKDAISKKGEKARIHFGVGAQSVGQVLSKHGLNPDDYAFYCYDRWDAEYEPVIAKRIVTSEVPVTKIDAITGYPFDTTEIVEMEEDYDTGEKICTLEAGENYGVRYEELLCFIMAAL